jgi:hypothetical protein
MLGIPVQFAGSFEEEEFGIWPENLPAVQIFMAMGTQWRIGMSGATGLDYSVLPAVFELYGITDRKQAFNDLRVMESAALEVMREK